MNSPEKAVATSQPADSHTTPGVSGRKLTTFILSFLVVVGGSLAYLLSVYDRMDDQRAKTSEVWRGVANALDLNYKQIVKLSAAELGVEEQWTQQFAEQAEQFRTATNIEAQLATASQIEGRLSELAASSSQPKLPEVEASLKEQIDLYNQNIDAETKILQSWAGSFVHKILPAPVRSKLDVNR